MSGRPAAESRRLKAHFVGAPFYVPPGLSNIEHRFAATGFNTGNLLIGDATARIANVDICHYGGGLRSESDNAGTDLIVIPSANFLSPAMDLSWLLPTIENSKQPIFMLGVGAQFPTTSVKRATLPDSTVRLMRLISERCHSIGARGPFTADVLRKYGISNVRVTGCPSLFGWAFQSSRYQDRRAPQIFGQFLTVPATYSATHTPKPTPARRNVDYSSLQ